MRAEAAKVVAAAAAFAQGPVASSAQQLRSQLSGLVNARVVRHVLLPPEDSPEWGGKWTSHTEHDWRRGNEMRITEVADRLQASSPRRWNHPGSTHLILCVRVRVQVVQARETLEHKIDAERQMEARRQPVHSQGRAALRRELYGVSLMARSMAFGSATSAGNGQLEQLEPLAYYSGK